MANQPRLSAHKRYYFDLVLAALPLLCMGFYFYGIRVLYLAAINCAVGVLCDYLVLNLLLKRRVGVDLSTIGTALIITLMLPPTAPYWLGPAGILFALIVAKYPFGGADSRLFSPAAVGFAFITLSFSKQVFAFTAPLTQLDVGAGSFPSAVSAAGSLKLGGIPPFSMFDMFIGNHPGPVGTTCILVLCTVFLYLVVRRSIDIGTIGVYIGTVVLLICLFPRSTAGPLLNIVYELGAGSMVFGGLFLLCDPIILPSARAPRYAYALFAGVMVVLFRYNGAFEEGLCFALIICQALLPALTVLVRRLADKFLEKGALRSGKA